MIEDIRPRIGVDIDDTLGDTLGTLIEHHNTHYGTALERHHFHTYDLEAVWGGTFEETYKKMKAFEAHPDFEAIRPRPDAQTVIPFLAPDFHLHAVTARPPDLRDLTRAWIEAHFPGAFRGLHMGNLYGPEALRRTKSEMCLALGIGTLIEDNSEYALDCAEHGIRVLLLDQLWNRMLKDSEYITRIASWQDAMHILRGIGR